MDIVHAAEMSWGANLASHRHGDMAHKLLFEGEEGSPDNHLLVLAREGSSYYSPRHRHAWDQVRFCLEGSVPLAKSLRLEAGEVAYFPEAVPYGPHEGGPDRIVLLLQFGGPSGLGYLSARQLRAGIAALEREGAFEGGVFRRTGGDGPKNQDAYEAIWRQVTGAPIAYPEPRYKAPIVMRPDAFAWKGAGPGVRRRVLGLFPERGLEVGFLALESGASSPLGPPGARRFVFVRSGEGRCEGQRCGAQTAVRLEPGEAARFEASAPTELFVISAEPVGRCPTAPNPPS
jgi:hypothetical protein